MSRRYAVVKPGSDLKDVMDAIEDAFDEVERSMLFVYSLTDESPTTRSHIWRRQGGDSVLVRLVEDDLIPATYVSVEAVNERDRDGVWSALANRLPAISLEDLQAWAEGEMERDPTVLQRLALGAAEVADPRTVQLVSRGLFNANEKVRTEAAMAAGITQWPEFAEPLRWALQSEASPDARRVIEAALASTDRDRSQGKQA